MESWKVGIFAKNAGFPGGFEDSKIPLAYDEKVEGWKVACVSVSPRLGVPSLEVVAYAVGCGLN